MLQKCPKDVKKKKNKKSPQSSEAWRTPPPLPHPHFICFHMGDVLRVPAVFAGCWAEWMATSSIDWQCGLQIKPQDKRLGRSTMKDHKGPHGKEMTTGRSGRPHPTTVALVPGRNGPDSTRQERLANLQNEVVHCGATRSSSSRKRSTGT